MRNGHFSAMEYQPFRSGFAFTRRCSFHPRVGLLAIHPPFGAVGVRAFFVVSRYHFAHSSQGRVTE